jgi:hypothetical protein
MNLDQILGLVRTLLAAGGPVVGILTAYGFPQDKVALWVGIALTVISPIVSAVWSVLNKTAAAKVAAAGAIEGVTVKVDTSENSPAPIGAQEAARDPKVPGVEPDKGGSP